MLSCTVLKPAACHKVRDGFIRNGPVAQMFAIPRASGGSESAVIHFQRCSERSPHFCSELAFSTWRMTHPGENRGAPAQGAACLLALCRPQETGPAGDTCAGAGDSPLELWGSPGPRSPLRKHALEGRCAQDTVPAVHFSCWLPVWAAAGEERCTFRIHMSGLGSAQTF